MEEYFACVVYALCFTFSVVFMCALYVGENRIQFGARSPMTARAYSQNKQWKLTTNKKHGETTTSAAAAHVRKKAKKIRETQPNQNVNHLHSIPCASACIPRINSHKIYNIFKVPSIHFIKSLWNSWLNGCMLLEKGEEKNRREERDRPDALEYDLTTTKTKLFDLSLVKRARISIHSGAFFNAI